MIVEYINSSGLPNWLRKPPKQGNFYTVINTVNSRIGIGFVLDECFEIRPNGNVVSYHENRFRVTEEVEISELLTDYITI